jgi:hypothetical protein
MIQQQLQTPLPNSDTQFKISNSQSNESENAPLQQDKNENENKNKDDWKNDSSGLVDLDNEDEDNIETEILQDNRGT